MMADLHTETPNLNHAASPSTPTGDQLAELAAEGAPPMTAEQIFEVRRVLPPSAQTGSQQPSVAASQPLRRAA